MQTTEGQAASVKPEPVTISGDFTDRPQACSGQRPSNRAEFVTLSCQANLKVTDRERYGPLPCRGLRSRIGAASAHGPSPARPETGWTPSLGWRNSLRAGFRSRPAHGSLKLDAVLDLIEGCRNTAAASKSTASRPASTCHAQAGVKGSRRSFHRPCRAICQASV